MGSHQGHGNFYIQNHAALGAVNMVVALCPSVVTAGLIRKRQLLDQTMFDEEVERSVDRAVADLRIAGTYALEDRGRRQVLLGTLDDFEDQGALSRRPEWPSVQ